MLNDKFYIRKMNLSKYKISGSTILLRFSSYCVTHDNIIFRGIYGFLKCVVSGLSGFNIFEIKSVKEYCDRYQFRYETLVKDRIGYSWTSSSNLFETKATCVSKQLPNIDLALIKDVCVTSNSDFIIDKRKGIVLNDYCANNDDANKTYVDGITLAYRDRCCLVKVPKQTESIPSGIMLNGKFSFNYYHNIYENLIRFILLEDYGNKIPAQIPVIIDSEVLDIPSLNLVVSHFIKKTGRSIFPISRNKLFSIGELYRFSAINYLTPQHINPSIGKAEDYLFDQSYTLKYAKELLELKSNKIFPRKIFITRNNVNKRNFNEDVVFEILKPYGFAIIAPETLSFCDQIALFHGAQFIIGGSGAAFTNMLFSDAGCKAIIIIGRGGNPNACFNAPAFMNDSEILFYQSTRNQNKGIHSNFEVDVNDFRHFVEMNVAPYCK